MVNKAAIEDRHWLSAPIPVFLGLMEAVCQCGEFRGNWEEYLLHCRAAHAVEEAIHVE